MAHKILKQGVPESLAALFTTNSDVRERSIRQDSLFNLPRPRLKTGNRRFGYQTAAMLNSLPADAVEQPTARFARIVKAALLSG